VITWGIPGLIYLGALAGQVTFAELVGANLMAGIMILLFGIGGLGRRIMVWLPLPIILGMFSGSILTYVTRMVEAGVNDVLVAGITLGAYLVGRLANTPKCPPVGLAVVIGGIAVYFFGQTEMQQLVIELPAPTVPEMTFSLGAFLGVSLPMVIFAMGLCNVQGIGFLMAQDYKVPINVVTISVGLGSILNSLFGGHAASVARSTTGIGASSSARPHEKRYWGNLIAAGLALTITLSAASVASAANGLAAEFRGLARRSRDPVRHAG
jgi:benzoate membrane transport protein